MAQTPRRSPGTWWRRPQGGNIGSYTRSTALAVVVLLILLALLVWWMWAIFT